MNISLSDIERLGIFREEVLGRVFEGSLRDSDRLLIVKEFLPPSTLDKKSRVRLRLRFFEESNALKGILNPSIAIPIGVIDDEESACVIYHQPVGIPYYNFLSSKGHLTHLDALHLLKRIVNCYALLAKNGIHRYNVIPNDFFITENNAVQMVDTTFAAFDRPSGLFDAGLLSGDRSFYAPEQIVKGKVGERALIFSLGLLFYHILTGERLFTAPSPIEILSLILTKPYSSLPENVHASPELEDLVRRMLHKDEANRFATLEELDKRIDEVIELKRVVETLHQNRKEARREEIIREKEAASAEVLPPSRRGAKWAAIAVFAIIVCLIFWFTLLKPSSGKTVRHPSTDLNLSRARRALDKSDWDTARTLTQEVLKNEGKNSVASLILGEAYFGLQNYEESIRHFQDAGKSQDESVSFPAGVFLSDCYVRVGRLREAEKQLRRMLDAATSERRDTIISLRKKLIALCLAEAERLAQSSTDDNLLRTKVGDFQYVVERIDAGAVELEFFRGVLASTDSDLKSALTRISAYCAARPQDAAAASFLEKLKSLNR